MLEGKEHFHSLEVVGGLFSVCPEYRYWKCESLDAYPTHRITLPSVVQ